MSENTSTIKKRVFKYDGHTFEDPGTEFSNEDMRNSLSGQYPALRNASVETVEKEDHIEVNFVKQAVTKG